MLSLLQKLFNMIFNYEFRTSQIYRNFNREKRENT